MTDPATSSGTETITLRVGEARVEDIGHAVARLAPADIARLGVRPGDVLKITGGTTAVARAELAEPGQEGVIQIDGTARSNCGAGLHDPVVVSFVESAQAVAVQRGWSTSNIRKGGLAAALRLLGVAPPARFMIIDVEGLPIEEVETGLTELSRLGSSVMVLGTVNDVNYFRRIMRTGARDYLMKPVDADELGEVFVRLEQKADGVTPKVLNGTIDSVFRVADGWKIVDYKTDVNPGELNATYQEQLSLYERALAGVGISSARSGIQSVRRATN